MDIPNARSHKDVSKKGYLQKLSSRSFPYIPHPWKRKFCILVKGHIFYYEKEDSKSVEKGSGVINLEYFDQVVEATAKDSKKASHVFIVTSQDRTFFDPGRHLFSADSEKDMHDWIRSLKKAIEQIRNNNRTTVAKLAAASSPRLLKSPSGASAKGKSEEGEGEESLKGRKKRAAENCGDEKENFEEFSPDTEQPQRRRGAASSPQSGDENSSPTLESTGTNSIGRNKGLDTQGEATSTSLGRKGKSKGSATAKQDFKYAPGDLEGMIFGSLGRPLKSEKGKGAKGGETSGGDASNTTNMERRKRKAEDDGEEAEVLDSPSSGPQLESVTKHRVKGPPGRRMPHSRRGHGSMMKHRASSLSALAHNGVAVDSGEGADDSGVANSFVPWLNRSLDLLEDPATYAPSRHSQPVYGTFIQSDQEDEPEEMFEYNIGFNEDTNLQFEEGGSNLFVQQVSGDSYSNTSNSGAAPPLPPRMESRGGAEFLQGGAFLQQQQQQQQLQEQFHQQQLLQSNNPFHNQVMSPFGSALQQPQQRQSFAVDEMNSMLMTRSMNSDLFITSFSDGDNSGGDGHQSRLNKDSTNSSGSSPAQKQRPHQGKTTKQANAKLNQQKLAKKAMMAAQPDVGRFNVAVRNLQKHVVELDQAVNGITKEVEDSKTDLNNFKTALLGFKKEKERLSDSVSIVAQEATKLKEQVSSTLKETEKLQKTATSALVVAEKAKVDQLNLKKEYEAMIIDLKLTIDKIKKEAAEGLGIAHRIVPGEEEEVSEEENDREVEKQTRGRKKKRESSTGRQGSKQSFFSRPSSIISGLTNRSSLTKSSSIPEVQDKDGVDESPQAKKKSGKERSVSRSKGKKGNKKVGRHMSDDFPMMDDTVSPRTMSPIGSDQDLSDADFAQNDNFNLGKSVSSPSVASRPRVLNLKSQRSNSQNQASPDSPTRPVSPFDVPRLHLNGRATSPNRTSLHRPGSTPGPLSRQGSMTTVPEDRAIDVRQTDNRPSDPPPPPPTSGRPGVFAISRQNSSPNISTQKSGAQPSLPRQHSLGVVLEENKPISRQSSIMSVPDERLIVDRTLPMSPTPSMMSFPGSWSTTSLNRQDSALSEPDQSLSPMVTPKIRAKGPLEQVAGKIVSGSSGLAGSVDPLDEKGEEPLATSSLKKRKKVKKDPVKV